MSSTVMSTPAAPAVAVKPSNERWKNLWLSVFCMVMIANLQYGWSVFVLPMQQAHPNWGAAGIQVAFTMFVALETWATPLNGWFADKIGPRFGPRAVMSAGGILCAVGWIINSYTDSLTGLYVGSILSGLGAGGVYCVSVGTAVKWFPDRRGLATGLVAAGFGAGAALTIIPIKMVIEADGYATAFFWFALIQGGAVFIASQFIRHPEPGEVAPTTNAKVQQSKHSYTSKEMLASWVFWVLYVCDVLMCAGGLVVTANLTTIAKAYNISSTVMIMSITTISMALVFTSIMNGVARPLFGWISDQIGLPKTMAIGFSVGAVSYFSLYLTGGNPWGFVFFAGMVFFCWGNIFSLFPAMCTNLFGPKYATTNTSLLYTAKGTAALLVPLGTILSQVTGSWNSVLWLATGINVIAVLVVWCILRPAANRFHAADQKAA